MNIDSNLEIATQVQQKFEFYFIALIFTLLGLSVQTGTLGQDAYADLFEILGWLSFLLSGLLGLSRLEWVPVQYNLYSHMSGWEKNIKTVQEHKLSTGKNQVIDTNRNLIDIDEYVVDQEDKILKVRERTYSIEKSTQLKYIAQKGLFIAGLIFVITSRSMEAIFNIIVTLK